MLDARTGLNVRDRSRFDRAIRVNLHDLLNGRDDRDVAAYLPFRGEPDLTESLQSLHRAGRRIWLPVVDGAELLFRRWRPGAELPANRYGIPEPAAGPECPPDELDLVLTPLVAYSPSGIRLGMGAGFYDRSFAFKRHDPHATPLMFGVAYTLQQAENLPAEDWDVPLAGVITEEGVNVFQ